MALPYIEYEKNIVDEGLETGTERLTRERVAKVVDKVINGETGARLKAYVDTCVHCGLCSDACHFYLSTKRDPKFTPSGRVKRSMSVLLKKRAGSLLNLLKKFHR